MSWVELEEGPSGGLLGYLFCQSRSHNINSGVDGPEGERDSDLSTMIRKYKS